MSTPKLWVELASIVLQRSLSPLPTEPNELDWKTGPSPNKERLVEHLSAFANYPNGGCIVFGIDNATARVIGVTQQALDTIVGQLANLGRDALEPPVIIDHAVIAWGSASILLVRIPEQPVKAVASPRQIH